MNKTMEKGISDIVGCLTDPIIVFPGGWGDTIPEWLKAAITLERMIGDMKALKGEEPTGTDAEACAYLMTLSLIQPMDSDWTHIYLYLAGKVFERHRAKDSGVAMPDDIEVESISDCHMVELRRLKDWIYRQRCKIRLERERVERGESRKEEAARKEAEQPALFDL